MESEEIIRGRRLLKLKGYEDEELEPEVVPEQVSEQFKTKKKADQDKSVEFDDLRLQWNSNGTLNRLSASRNGTVLYVLDFAWNYDGTLSNIFRR